MAISSWLLTARKIIGRIADFFIAGRTAGMWSKEDGPKGGIK
jgi:hypothetical protein